MSDPYQLEIKLRGPARTVERHWGPSEERETFAELQIPVAGPRGWMIYQEAIQRALMPDAVITFPDGMSDEDVERWRAEWAKEHRG